MIWIEGAILWALEEAARCDALLLVFIDAEDEESFKVRTTLDRPPVSSVIDDIRCIPVRIRAGSAAHKMFGTYATNSKPPGLYLMNANGKVELAIEEYVPPNVVAKRLSPVIRGGVEERCPSPVTMIVEKITARGSPSTAVASSGVSVDNGATEDDNGVWATEGGLKGSAFADVPVKTPYGTPWTCSSPQRNASPLCEDAVNVTRHSDQENELQDDGLPDDDTFWQGALPSFAMITRRFAEKVLGNAITDARPLCSHSFLRIRKHEVRARKVADYISGETGDCVPTNEKAARNRLHCDKSNDNATPNDGEQGESDSPPTPMGDSVLSDLHRDTTHLEESKRGIISHTVGDGSAFVDWLTIKTRVYWPSADPIAHRPPFTLSSSKREEDSGIIRATTIEEVYSRKVVTSVPPSPGHCEGLDGIDDAGVTPWRQFTADKIRMIFNFEDGSSVAKWFPDRVKLSDVQYAVQSLLSPGRIPKSSVVFTRPNRLDEFNAEEYSKTLKELELDPMATTVVSVKSASENEECSQGRATVSPSSSFLNWLWLVCTVLKTPLLYLWDMLVASGRVP